MTRQELDPFLNRLSKVTTRTGPTVAGTLERADGNDPILDYRMLQLDGTYVVFGSSDVISIESVHAAEEVAHAEECTCSGKPGDSEDELRRWLDCAVHAPDLSDAADYRDYCDWRSRFFSAVREYVPLQLAGKWSGIEGDFEKVVFQVSATDKRPERSPGGVLITISLADASPTPGKRRTTLIRNWRNDFASAVAREAIAAFEVELIGKQSADG